MPMAEQSPSEVSMYPIWEMLWNAKSRLKSCWFRAMVTQTNMETQPIKTSPVCMLLIPMLLKRK